MQCVTRHLRTTEGNWPWLSSLHMLTVHKIAKQEDIRRYSRIDTWMNVHERPFR